MYAQRRLREDVFGKELFADAIWDILLGLFIAEEEGRQMTIGDACDAGCVPHTTGLRQLARMESNGLILRKDCTLDSRRTYLFLSENTKWKMTSLIL